jgi:Zn-dependent peptidase ImmA (M78 family)/transcriptional regulator with XRE-family HTH domain
MIATRMRSARVSCGMTLEVLSSRTGIPTSRLSKIENGLLDASNDDITKVSDATSIPVGFFIDAPLYQVSGGRFRKQSSAPKKKIEELAAKTCLIAEVIDEATTTYRLPKPTITPFDGSISGDTIEEAAQRTRSEMGLPDLGPIGNMTRACERSGVAVAKIPMPNNDRKLSAYSVWADLGERTPLVVVSTSLPGDVLRGTIAHEVGHLILHTKNPSVDAKDAEPQAWLFANYLLFPRENAELTFASEPVTLRRLERLKAVYGVSISFLLSCCKSYGIINEERNRSLRKQYSARGWYGNEPVAVGIERPSLVPQVLKKMNQDGMTIGMQSFLAAKLMAA